MNNYLDDIEFLINVARETFWPKPSDDRFNNYDEFVSALTSDWAATYAITKCYDNVYRDPCDILEEEANNYQIESTFGKQEINKRTYDTAAQALLFIRNELLKRRKEINE